MAPHSSTLAWKIPWTEEPGRLQSMRSRRVKHDWVTSLSLFTFLHWRRKWQSTPVFLPVESQGQQRLLGCRLWGHTEWDTTGRQQERQKRKKGRTGQQTKGILSTRNQGHLCKTTLRRMQNTSHNSPHGSWEAGVFTSDFQSSLIEGFSWWGNANSSTF